MMNHRRLNNLGFDVNSVNVVSVSRGGGLVTRVHDSHSLDHVIQQVVRQRPHIIYMHAGKIFLFVGG